jgi:hypothetical protein
MSVISIYFQYTHFSNVELSSLRSLIFTNHGKMQLISSKYLTRWHINSTFGKLMVIRFPKELFRLSFIHSLLSQFNVLRLLFIELDSFILSPTLYTAYTAHNLGNTSVHKLICLSYCINNTRMLLFRFRYFLLSIYILFQENLLLKNNTQYIC